MLLTSFFNLYNTKGTNCGLKLEILVILLYFCFNYTMDFSIHSNVIQIIITYT